MVAGLLLLVGATCELEDPCLEYVDYMCACHVSEADCEELETTYQDADPDLQDQCAIDLADQQAEDDENGVECEVI